MPIALVALGEATARALRKSLPMEPGAFDQPAIARRGRWLRSRDGHLLAVLSDELDTADSSEEFACTIGVALHAGYRACIVFVAGDSLALVERAFDPGNGEWVPDILDAALAHMPRDQRSEPRLLSLMRWASTRLAPHQLALVQIPKADPEPPRSGNPAGSAELDASAGSERSHRRARSQRAKKQAIAPEQHRLIHQLIAGMERQTQ